MTTSGFLADYECHLADFCGFAFNSRRPHLRVIRNFLDIRFPLGRINWHALQFTDLAEFLKKEFRRLPNVSTQRVWLAAMRRFVRHLASEGLIPNGWEDALPKRVNWKRASLPRFLAQEEKQALWRACTRKTHRQIRDRAMLLVFTRLGLRTEEVARLALNDIDWKRGEICVCSSKTRRERMLPLPQDVGDGLIEHLRARPQKDAPWLFVPRRPPFTEQRRHDISALLHPEGLPAQVLLVTIAGPTARLCVSGEVYAEYEEVIRRPRFKRSESEIANTLGAIREAATWVRPAHKMRVCSDPDDDVFLECAEVARAHYLVTGNLKTFSCQMGRHVGRHTASIS
jgi:putative PIN family toxin of toxin-antitoxin system